MSVGSYRVNYPANLIEPASAVGGSADLVHHVTSRAVQCPYQRFILVGYSQGAYIVDNSIGAGVPIGIPGVPTIPAFVERRVAAVLLFGNPLGALGRHVTGAYANRTTEFCAFGDPVCQMGGMNPAAHLSYAGDSAAAAAYVADHI